eukprot:5545029-Amphidinium_carterae.2
MVEIEGADCTEFKGNLSLFANSRSSLTVRTSEDDGSVPHFLPDITPFGAVESRQRFATLLIRHVFSHHEMVLASADASTTDFHHRFDSLKRQLQILKQEHEKHCLMFSFGQQVVLQMIPKSVAQVARLKNLEPQCAGVNWGADSEGIIV